MKLTHPPWAAALLLACILTLPFWASSCRNNDAAAILAEATLPMVEHLEPWTRAGIEADESLRDSEKADLLLELDVLKELMQDQLDEKAADEEQPAPDEHARAGAALGHPGAFPVPALTYLANAPPWRSSFPAWPTVDETGQAFFPSTL